MKRLVLGLALLAWLPLLTGGAQAQTMAAPGKVQVQVQVMVLGTYHFGNPGLDLHNAKVDDVMAPKRQAEITQVLQGLAGFKPTRVAVEVRADAEPGYTLPAYRRFRDGQSAARRNEIDQIGYRLARELGHAEVYGIDVDGAFPFEPVQAFAATHGGGAVLQGALDELGARTKAFEARQATASIGQLLRWINTFEANREEASFYARLLAFGRGADQPGAALLASWSARNLGICARLVQVVQQGQPTPPAQAERVLVVYGSGHAALLRSCVQQMPGWQLVEPHTYLPR